MKNKKLFAILTLLCFMMTLMPVAAFAADYQTSYVYTVDSEASVAEKEEVGLVFDLDGTATTVYVWFVEDGYNVPTTATEKYTDSDVTGTHQSAITETVLDGVFAISPVASDLEYDFMFSRSGNYTVYASLEDPNAVTGTTAEKIANVEKKLGTAKDQKKIEVYGDDISTSKYAAKVVKGDGLTTIEYYKTNSTIGGTVSVEANNVAEEEITLKFVDGYTAATGNDAEKIGDAVKGATVKLDTNSSSIQLNKTEATTNASGQVSFKVSGSTEGNYKVYVTLGSYTTTINVKVGGTGAAYINVVKEPTDPVDIDMTRFDDFIRLSFTDINGNALTNAEAAADGAVEAYKATDYVSVISQPAKANLKNKDLKLVARKNAAGVEQQYEATIESKKALTVEGTYEFKVVLDNGNYKTVKLEVKEFTTPVKINLVYAAPSVELGGQLNVDKLEYVDANGVVKSAKGKVDLAATGKAIRDFDTTTGKITVSSDDKYIGSEITITAVDDRYNLVATASLTVADEAKELKFDTKTAEVNVNNTIGVQVVDSQGNRVALGRGYDANGESVVVDSIKYVVLDKPADAKVSVNTASANNNILSAGSFKMNLTSNKVGNVTVQAIAKVTYNEVDENDKQNTVVRYYTGTQIFAVGNGSVGDVVVMSIGSSEIIVNDAKATIDAAPMIQNDRTYVPFRALAEAFGAEVAYDEATQAVTAELNGVKVVMTIGSATYTVNDAEKTMDVAPFINGSRTMVPVRFAAEAFGIKVIPTYDENGATADILFNL